MLGLTKFGRIVKGSIGLWFGHTVFALIIVKNNECSCTADFLLIAFSLSTSTAHSMNEWSEETGKGRNEEKQRQ